jgi:hypothetical protein
MAAEANASLLRQHAAVILARQSAMREVKRRRQKQGQRETLPHAVLRARPTKSESYLRRFGKERGSRIPLKECRHVAFWR